MAAKLPGYLLSDSDRQVIDELRRRLANERRNPPVTNHPEFYDHPAPEVYVALVPAGGIPGLTTLVATGTGSPPDEDRYVPGKAECDFYKVSPDDDEEALQPLGFGRDVYNACITSVSGSQFIPVQRDKAGKWWVNNAQGSGDENRAWYCVQPGASGTGSGTGTGSDTSRWWLIEDTIPYCFYGSEDEAGDEAAAAGATFTGPYDSRVACIDAGTDSGSGSGSGADVPAPEEARYLTVQEAQQLEDFGYAVSGPFTSPCECCGSGGSGGISNGDTVENLTINNLTTTNSTASSSIITNLTTTSLTVNNGGSIHSNTAIGDTLLFQAYDVDGASYITFATLTSSNTPTFVIQNSTITNTTINNTTVTGTMTVTVPVTWTDDIRQIFNPGTNVAGINVGQFAGNPTTLVDGDVWYNTTTNAFMARINGSNVILGAAGAGLVSIEGIDDGGPQTGPALVLDWETTSTDSGIVLPAWIGIANTLTLQLPYASPAAIHGGLVSNQDQTFGGVKTFRIEAGSSDTAVNTVNIDRVSTTPATITNGFGSQTLWHLQTADEEEREAAACHVLWADSTNDACRSRIVWYAYDGETLSTDHARECLRMESSGTVAIIGFLGAGAVVRQTSGADLTNNVTSGGTTDIVADYSDLLLYANDAATIRNNIYQLAKKLKQINDGLRLLGLFN